MSPLLQTFANGSALGYRSRGIAGAATSFESIATANPNSASVTFSSIPGTYTHLQIRGIARSASYNGAADYYSIRLNSDSNGNYNAHGLYGDGSSASSFGRSGNQTEIFAGEYAGAAASSNIFGGIVIDILDYADTNKYKTLRYLVGNDRNGSGQIMLASGLWKSTSAITSISLTGYFGGGFANYSQFALYGIKGAA